MLYLNKTILITGAAGSIGSELARQIYKRRFKKLLLLDQDETRLFEVAKELPKAVALLASIRNKDRIFKIFEKFKPDLVFHAAAYKHVGMLEDAENSEMWETNVQGLKNVAENALKFKATKFIFISSDKAVNPISVMGRSKAIGEKKCKEYYQNQYPHKKTRFIAVRFGNVLTSRGSVIPIWRKQIEENKPITVTDILAERYFMTIFETCELVMSAAEMGKGGEIFTFDMGEAVKILDLAKTFVRLSGKNLPIEITGLKPGEKLSEKLVANDEKLIPTKYPKIFKVVKK